MFSFDFADVKPSVLNILIIVLIVVMFVPLLKYLVTRFPIPGFSELVLSV